MRHKASEEERPVVVRGAHAGQADSIHRFASGEQSAFSAGTAVAAATPGMVIAVVVTLIFINKAYTIDDLLFLLMSQHMLVDPLHSTAFQLVFHGVPARASAAVTGPVMAALLLPAVAADGSEWIAHLAMLAVFLLGLFSCAQLALRLGLSTAGAVWVVLLVATSPAVLAMATTSMPDVPAMSFGAMAVERLVAFRQRPRVITGAAASIALALAVLSRTHLVALFACAVPLMLDKWPANVRQLAAVLRQRRFVVRLSPIACAVILLAVVVIAQRDPLAGANLLNSTAHSIELRYLNLNLANLPAQWVLTFPLGVVWGALQWRRMVRNRWAWGGAALGVTLAALSQSEYHHWRWMVWQAPVTALGMAVLADILVLALRRRDTVDLALATWLLIAWPAALYPHLPPKFLVPSAPAMAILIARHASVPSRPLIAGRVILAGVSAGLALGLLIAQGDAVLAEVGRIGGRDVVADEMRRGNRVWFDGGWGFQWYAMQAGAAALTIGLPAPARGDVVVVGLTGHLMNGVRDKKLLRRIVFEQPGGRVEFGAAGFFDNTLGLLPWRWSAYGLQPIEVWRIE